MEKAFLESSSESVRRDAPVEARLAIIEARVAEAQGELDKLAKLLRGNGEGGLFAQIELQRERIEALQTQWRWALGFLTALGAAVAQAILRK